MSGYLKASIDNDTKYRKQTIYIQFPFITIEKRGHSVISTQKLQKILRQMKK